MEKPIISIGRTTKFQIYFNSVIALVYLGWWMLPGHIGNPVLYGILLFGECYHVLMSYLFWSVIFPRETNTKPNILHLETTSFRPTVDIFITVAGEDVDVVRKTINAVKDMHYPNFSIYVLNDGYVAQKNNWEDIERMCKKEHVHCITRKVGGGAKAGNINNALRATKGEFIIVFDADMRPYPDFLEKTIYYFQDKKLAFVQSPQYYENNDLNNITRSAWEQQEFFFGPIMFYKDKLNSAFICGTNFVIRREALEEVGGMNEKNIAEDFLTSLSIHQRKWKSYYVSEVLARGLAPEDLLSYYKQQLRWARGSLEVLFNHNPFLKRGLTFSQKKEYFASALFYFNGFINLLDMTMPLIFLFSGLEPVATTTTSFALFFIPFMALNLYTMYIISRGSLTFSAISFTMSSWPLQVQALLSALLRLNMKFAVTSKKALSGNFIHLAYPHLIYILLVIIGTGVGIAREGLNPSVITNLAWAGFNCIMFVPFILAALKTGNSISVSTSKSLPSLQKV